MLLYLRALSLVVLLTTFATGCQKRHVVVPIAPVPAPAGPTETVPASEPVTPPVVPPAATTPAPQPATPAQIPPPQAPPPQPPPQNPPARRSSGPGQPAPAPRLGDILTPQQERQYNTAIDQSLARAQSSLGSIGNRQLTKEQQGVVTQIQGFIQQAQATRKSNLPAARSLAERADVLARDLAGSLK